MEVTIFSPDEYTVSEWSGGTTAQMYIYPPEAQYAKRDFLLRLSSATVADEESDFTKLPGIDRLIMTLDKAIELEHGGKKKAKLKPFESYAFSGGDDTVSRGKCTDFNVMIKSGTYEKADLFVNEAAAFDLYPYDGVCFLYAASGSYEIVTPGGSYKLAQNQLARLRDIEYSKIRRTDVDSKMVVFKLEW